MTIFVGNRGSFRLARNNSESVSTTIAPADVNTTLKRVSMLDFQGELITGDQIDISTTDPRLLAFLAPSAWTNNTRYNQGTFYINVNAVGGVRFFREFSDAVANNRAKELSVATFSGGPITVTVTVRSGLYRALARVQSYRFSTDREAQDTTSLTKGYREHEPGLITGSGSLDILYDYKLKSGETDQEVALAIFQILTRLRAGAQFDTLLYVRTPDYDKGETGADAIFYEFKAVITRCGIDAAADRIVQASVDFVTTGEVEMKVGTSNSLVLKGTMESNALLRDLDYLLEEQTD